MIDPMSPAPLFKQVADALADRIAAGNLIPGNPLPSERAIQLEYHVAPWTARAAVDELRKRGLVVTLPQGRTYVRES